MAILAVRSLIGGYIIGGSILGWVIQCPRSLSFSLQIDDLLELILYELLQFKDLLVSLVIAQDDIKLR
jgi:hypothetical protein